MSYEIVRTSQFRKDYKLMRKRGKAKQKLEEVLRHSFSCYFAKNFLHGHELPHDNLCRRAAITTAEPPEPLTFQHSDCFYSNKTFRGLTAQRRGFLFIPCIQWTTKNSCSFVSIRGSKSMS